MKTFEDSNLCPDIIRGLKGLGYSAPTDIQSLAMPVIADRKNAYISAATGTGKTFAYAAPIISRLYSDGDSNNVRAVILTPTQDLAAQIEHELYKLAEPLGIRTALALGSMSMKRQLERLAVKPHIVVGSVGRVRDLVYNKHIDLKHCLWLVLDEGDKLFENEVIDLSSDVLSAAPETSARILVSASIPLRVKQRSARWFKDAQDVILDQSMALRERITHWCFYARLRDKLDILRRFNAAVHPDRCLVCASSNAAIYNMQKQKSFLGFEAVYMQSVSDSSERKHSLAAFAAGKSKWLISSDLAARGLDIPGISHVIHYDLPQDPHVYLHRAGRTGRAGNNGISVLIADELELKRASNIAVRYGFTFHCKELRQGAVMDAALDDFFARVNAR